VHHVTVKPVLYGSIAARLVGGIAVVNAISGLGYAFTSTDAIAAILRPVLRLLYRVALHQARTTTIFQNPDDMSDFVNLGLVKQDQSVLIRGSGVDCAIFQPTPEPTGRPVVLLAARMIWDKGVGEFVEVARLMKARDDAPRFVLVGAPDPGNPGGIPVAQMEAWSREGVIEWWGQRADMPTVLGQASIVVLPTVYGEGVPKILLEAAAAGRPIVATDIRGCREIVRPDENGFLVPPRDRVRLVSAIDCLLASAELRARFGQAGRHIVETEFSEPMIVQQQLAVFEQFWPMNAVRGLTRL
jgi:glycosyltransferase involved in cell wall biosynthesis